ncbi:hypothetical protein GGR53DRAFT_482099 [Hypoxylon sp. FL1150]|nr:hypothetical protein GGR53DRAFT_482099 [Hypoxylon sp. FL1150]
MPRRQRDGKQPPRYKAKKLRLRWLIPRNGFDLADKRCRAMLSGVDSVAIKDHIRAFAGGDLNKTIVDSALAALFDRAVAALREDPEKIADAMPGEFWGAVQQTLPWTSDALAGHTIFTLVVALVVAHEAYDAAFPYDRFKHQYGKLAEAVHQFSALLKCVYIYGPTHIDAWTAANLSLF